MSRKYNVLVIALALFFIFAIESYAAPTISSINGKISGGESVSIVGNDFGTRSNTPIKWDNFENGVLGERLSTQGYATYTGTSGDSHRYSNHFVYSGKQAAIKSGKDNNFVASGVNNLSLDEMYLSFWFRWDATGSASRVNKILRVTSGTNMYNSWPGLWYTGNGMSTWHYYGSVDDNERTTQKDMSFIPKKNTWNRLELYYKHSTGTSSNGIVRWWWNGSPAGESVNVRTRIDNNKKIKNIIFPAMPDANQGGDFWFGIDDLYIDRTQARVEMCVGSTWSQRGKCDIQIPTSWTNTQIGIRVNEGTMQNSGRYYLYVVNPTGSANQSGVPITFNTSSGGSTPPPLSPPKNLRIVNP